MDASSDDDGAGPWAIKVHGFPEFPRGFSVDVMFSVADKVFWADLSRGVAYSDLRQGGSVVDVVYVQLPDGHQIDMSSSPVDVEIDPPNMTRTMGCVQGSVKFVCIDRGMPGDPGTAMVKVWTLDLDPDQLWKEDKGYPWEELWTQACLLQPGLRDVHLLCCPYRLQPLYPVLMTDGVLCLLLPKTRHRSTSPCAKPDYICSFDMFNKRCLSLRQVRGYHFISPVVLPYEFFKNCYPAPKRKSPTRKRKQPSINSCLNLR